ncbi:hypothetical protein HAX54_011835, partial [Datura stramonium]|nr:hypothetical protein [Datura stramonium]
MRGIESNGERSGLRRGWFFGQQWSKLMAETARFPGVWSFDCPPVMTVENNGGGTDFGGAKMKSRRRWSFVILVDSGKRRGGRSGGA